MTTATTTTTVAQDTTAHFNAWFNEVITELLAVGLTQTADTGQISTGGAVAIPSANTAAGYTIWRFNDTAQATTPIFIKIEFGSGGGTTTPQMWITTGQGSNGSGTLTGALTTRVSLTDNFIPSSLVTNYVSRWCYNTTWGALWMNWKQAGNGTANSSLGGFAVLRSNSNAAAVTTDAYTVFANSVNATGGTSNNGSAQAYSNLTTGLVNASPNTNWAMIPLAQTTTVFGGNNYVAPVVSCTPVPQTHFAACLAVLGELGLNTTQTLTPVGSTSATFIQVGLALGNTATLALANTSWGLTLLWQ